jgi:hypothetical protein
MLAAVVVVGDDGRMRRREARDRRREGEIDGNVLGKRAEDRLALLEVSRAEEGKE